MTTISVMNMEKNMAIPYKPIYFADSSLNENEYATSLNEVFYHAYQYDEVLPSIKSIEIEAQYRLNEFHLEQEYLNYEQIILENKQDKIKLFYQLNASVENLRSIILKIKKISLYMVILNLL